MKDKYVPFLHWQRGGMTHYEDCWKDHLTCALIRGVDLLEEYAIDCYSCEESCSECNDPKLTEFIKHIREEM